MRKGSLVAAGAAIVAGGIVLSAGYFGAVAERTLRDRVANMPYGLEVEVAEYQRGWFSSTARLEWRALQGAMPSEALREISPYALPPMLRMLISGPIAADIEIAHGPVYFAVGPGVGLFNARGRIPLGAEASDATLYTPDGPRNEMEVFLSSVSGRTVHNRIQAPRLALDPGELSMKSRESSPGDAHGDLPELSLVLEDFVVEGEWAGSGSFQLQRAALGSMEILAVSDDGDLRFSLTGLEERTEYPRGLQSGAVMAELESVGSIGEIMVDTTGGDVVMRAAGMESRTTTSISGDGLFGVESSTDLEVLHVMGREFGPVRLDLGLGGFAEDAVLALIDQLSAGDGTAVDVGVPGLAAALPQATPELLEALRLHLSNSPYVNLDLALTYGGEHNLSLTMHQAFDGELVPAAATDLNLASFVAGYDFFLNIKVPIMAANELAGERLVQLGLTMGLLREQNEDYVFSLAARKGEFELQGNDLDPSQILPPPSAVEGASRSPIEITRSPPAD